MEFFQRGSLSPTLFGLAFIIVSYTIRQIKFGYIPGPPGNRNSNQMKTHGLLMNDINVYSTSHQQLEKVIQQAAYVIEKRGLSLGLSRQVFSFDNKSRKRVYNKKCEHNR